MYWIMIRDIGTATLPNAMGPFKDQGSAENTAKGLSAGIYNVYGPDGIVSSVTITKPEVTVRDAATKTTKES